MLRASWVVVLSFAFVTGTALAEGPKKVLMFTKSAGFEHSVVKRKSPEELSQAERTMTELGKKMGFEVECTKDGTKLTAANLKNYQGLLFFSQGELDTPGLDKNPPQPTEERQAIVDFVKAGGGFVGVHCGGTDTYHRWEKDGKKPYLDMVGGEFTGHGKQQKTKLEVVDKTFPAVAHLPESFELNDEWYAFSRFNENMHVLIMIETTGMDGHQYQRPPYPITWCNMHEKGRVFYTALGHREDVWENEKFQTMMGTAVKWSLKEVGEDVKPNLKELYGDVASALGRFNTQGIAPPKAEPPKKPVKKPAATK